jgi:hypothetical protein
MACNIKSPEIDMQSMKLIAAAVLAAFALPALPQTDQQRLDIRQERQKAAIEKGVQSGQITKEEAARLQKGQEKVRRMEKDAMADKKMTKKEKVELEQAQDRQDERIRNAMDQKAAPQARIDTRQGNQQARIDKGVKSGQLTKEEAAYLQKGQEHVQKLETEAKADGVITKEEKERIEQAQDLQRQRIRNEGRDGQKK